MGVFKISAEALKTLPERHTALPAVQVIVERTGGLEARLPTVALRGADAGRFQRNF